MPKRVQRYAQNTAIAANFVGLAGEFIFDTGLNAIRVHDGATPGGFTTLMNNNNLNDVSNKAQARINLGITATGLDTTYNFRANNLSDVANIATSRTNLGLGTAATQNTGTSGANLPFLNGTNVWSAANTFAGININGALAALSAGQGILGATAVSGLIVQGNGSTNDIVLLNKTGTAALVLPTGTQNIQLLGAIQVAGTVSGAIKADGSGNYAAVTGATFATAAGLGTASLQNTGTSGANVPLLNTANTWALAQTFTTAPVFTDQSGSRTALGLGTAATQNTGTSGGTLPFLNGSNTWSAVQHFSGSVGAGTVTIDRGGSIASRFRLFVGDGTAGTVIDEAYIAVANSNLHYWAGAAGTTEFLSISNAGAFVFTGTVNISAGTTIGGLLGANAGINATLSGAGTAVTITYNSATQNALVFSDTNAGGQAWIIGGGVGFGSNTFGIYDNSTTKLLISTTSAGVVTFPQYTGGTMQTNGSGVISVISDVTMWGNLVGNSSNYVLNNTAGTPNVNTVITTNHGFGTVPRAWGWGIRCLTSEFGWAIGDVVTSFSVGSANGGCTMFANTTVVGIVVSNNGINVQNKGTGGGTNTITPANWTVIHWAFK